MSKERLIILFVPILAGILEPPCAAQESPRDIVVRALKACGVEATAQPMALRARYCLHPAGALKQALAGVPSDLLVDIMGQASGSRSRVEFIDPDTNQTLLTMVSQKGGSWTAEKDEVTADSTSAWPFEPAAHMARLIWLAPLLRDAKFTTILEERRFEGRLVDALQAAYPGRPSVLLSFDKTTGLMARAQAELRLEVSVTFRAYREVDWTAPDRELLRKAGINPNAASVVKFLKGQLPDAPRKAEIARLIDQLGDKSFKAREAAGKALRAMGKPARDALMQKVGRADREVALRARKIVGQIETNPVDERWRAAIRIIGWTKPAGASELLMGFVPHVAKSTDVVELESSLGALAYRDGRADPHLLQALRGPEASRRFAAAALGRDRGAAAKRPGRRLYLTGLKAAHRLEFSANQQRLFDLELIGVEIFNQLEERFFVKPLKVRSTNQT